MQAKISSPLSHRHNHWDQDIEFKKKHSILSHRTNNLDSLLQQKRFLSPNPSPRQQLDEYEQLVNNYPRNKNQSKYAIGAQVRQMARMEASNSEIRENMKMIPVLTPAIKQTVVKKQSLGLAPWNSPPALMDGSLIHPSQKIIQNFKNNIEMEESFQRPSLRAKYHN